MSLRFPYQPVGLKGPPGAVHPSGETKFWRPFVEVRIIGPHYWYDLPQALIDTGAQDTVFPWDLHALIGAQLRPDAGYVLRWRGTAYPLRFADVELQLTGSGSVWKWTALVGFSPAPLPYVLLGHFGFLQYMDAAFLGDQLVLELETNSAYPGTRT